MNTIVCIYLGVVYLGCLAYCCRNYESDVLFDPPMVQSAFKTESVVALIPSGKECIICLEEYGDKEVLFLDCCHSFHKNCIEQWMLKKKECPICSYNIL